MEPLAVCRGWGRPGIRVTVLGSCFLLALVLPTPRAGAQSCFQSWNRPVVCQLRVEARDANGRWRRVDGGDRLRIPAGGSMELRVEALDQGGWSFPNDRLKVGIDLGRDCQSLVHLAEDSGDGRYRLVAGSQRGRCEATLWLPGNMNLDTPIRLEVVSRARAGYTHAQARFVARRLYLAILGREPDPTGWNGATQEIQRGRLKQQIRAMVVSAEFRSRQRSLSPPQFLEELYRGLLDREPDSKGVRTYLRRLERGQTAEVIYDIIRSEEFEKKLLGSSQPHSIHEVRPGR